MYVKALKLITDSLMWLWMGQPAAPQPIAMEAMTQGLVNAQEQRISLPADMQREVLAWADVSPSAQNAQLDVGIKNFLVSKLCRKYTFTHAYEPGWNDNADGPRPDCRIHGAVLSPDGNYLFIGSTGYHPIIWDMRTGKKHAVLNWAGQVTSANFSADGKYLITGSHSNYADLWYVKTGKKLDTLIPHERDRGNMFSVSLSHDGKYALTATTQSAALWDLAKYKPQQYEFYYAERMSEMIESAALSPDGKYIVVVSASGEAKLWDVASVLRSSGFNPAPLYTLSTHNNKIGDKSAVVRFSPNGSAMLVGGITLIWLDNDSYENLTTVTLWDLRSAPPRLTHKFNHSAEITSAAFSPDGKSVLIGLADNTAELRDVQSGTLLHTFHHPAGVSFSSVAFSPDGTTVVIGLENNSAIIWDVQSGILLGTVPYGSNHYKSYLHTVLFTSDGRSVITARGRQAIVWDLSMVYEVMKDLKNVTVNRFDLLQGFAQAIKEKARIHATREQMDTFHTLPEKIQGALQLYIKPDSDLGKT